MFVESEIYACMFSFVSEREDLTIYAQMFQCPYIPELKEH